jgi:hypothetical protein
MSTPRYHHPTATQTDSVLLLVEYIPAQRAVIPTGAGAYVDFGRGLQPLAIWPHGWRLVGHHAHGRGLWGQ